MRKRLAATFGRALISRALIAAALALTVVSGSWGITSLKEHKFQGVPDGSEPDGALVSDGAGNFYGTTTGGGRSSCGFSAPFCGTVFKMSPGEDGGWKETVIYRFKGNADGAGPEGTLIFDAAGNLYGTTITGGNDEVCNGEGCGTVFKLSPNQNGGWTETVLHRFLGSTDAQEPGSGVVFDKLGNLYGSAGGGCIEECNGTIFKLAPNSDGSWTESILYTFLGGTDGGFPSALAVDGAGNLFGTTASGGVSNSPCGLTTWILVTLSKVAAPIAPAFMRRLPPTLPGIPSIQANPPSPALRAALAIRFRRTPAPA